MTQAEQHALDTISAHGLRLTTARRTLIATLSELAEPATISDIAAHTDIDTATTYRNVKTLLEIGLLEVIPLEDGTARYALTHEHHHDHIVCTNCGTIVHIPCTEPTTPITHPAFYSITHHSITYFGLCTQCHASSASE